MSDGMTNDELNDIERFAPAWSSSPLRIAIAKLIAEIRRLWNTRQPPKLPRVRPEDLVERKWYAVRDGCRETQILKCKDYGFLGVGFDLGKECVFSTCSEERLRFYGPIEFEVSE